MTSEFELSDNTPVYVISVAAQLSGLHPQTLRSYDRLGLVSPGRTAGGGRRYSLRDILILREVQRLSAEGVNLLGIKRILELELAEQEQPAPDGGAAHRDQPAARRAGVDAIRGRAAGRPCCGAAAAAPWCRSATSARPARPVIPPPSATPRPLAMA